MANNKYYARARIPFVFLSIIILEAFFLIFLIL